MEQAENHSSATAELSSADPTNCVELKWNLPVLEHRSDPVLYAARARVYSYRWNGMQSLTWADQSLGASGR